MAGDRGECRGAHNRIGGFTDQQFLGAPAEDDRDYLGAAIGIAAFVPQRLSIWRGFFVQLASAFVGVAMPPTVGHVAVSARYLHREKVDEGTIAAAVTVSQLVNIVTTVLLLITLGVLTGSGLSQFTIAPGGDVLIGLAVIAAVVIAALAVPQTRKKVTGTVDRRRSGCPSRPAGSASRCCSGAVSCNAPRRDVPACLMRWRS